MPLELRLAFSGFTHVAVSLHGKTEEYSPSAAFASPLNEKDNAELRWYVEDYGTGYRAEPDDQRAAAVRDKLPVWGAALFSAVFDSDRKATELFRRFLDAREEGRVLSIAADHAAVLSLPWEILHAPNGTFLFNQNPSISIRRGLPAAKQECAPQLRAAKPVLRLLFIISRPKGVKFLNPRRDAQAVLNALEQQKQVRVEVEFLQLATLAELQERLRQKTVDIIHFDGHGELAMKQGWLIFESEEGSKDFVSGKAFGDLLNSSHTGLVVLSACQSAMMDSEDLMSGVAAQLVHAGIPAVIAMSYKTLAATTELLFAEFYRNLFEGRSVARSLDEARHTLYASPERGKSLRGAHNTQEMTLELHDWFLPVLYQSGADMALLSAETDNSLLPQAAPLHNLPPVQESGFFGRSWELWQIERFFTVNHCRRISITGFGGQGKTALACEAGCWLLRTKLFRRACFVSYAAYQGCDPVSMAVSTMSKVFRESLLDAAAAQASLENTATLLILDNLETWADDGTLDELLDAAALWSEAGDSRVLLTSRQPDFQHPAYPLASKQEHRHIALQGLCENDAVDWFDEMYNLPPEAKQPRPQRDVLVSLFEKVGFHPLSISLLAQQLKERDPADMGERLEALLPLQPLNQENLSLLASLELSLERLPEQCRKWLQRLGVFQGGCLEEMVCCVTGIEEADWQELRSHLRRAALMQEEQPVKDRIWLRFHPTLAPALWENLDEAERFKLMERHSQAYCQFADKMYDSDKLTVYEIRSVVRQEMYNLLRAAHWCVERNKERSAAFAANICAFLNIFFMQTESQVLSELAANRNYANFNEWFTAQVSRGKHLYTFGNNKQAQDIFAAILEKSNTPYQRCLAMSLLGRSFDEQGRLDEAEKMYHHVINELNKLDQDDDMRRYAGIVQVDLGILLVKKRDYHGAKQAYSAACAICEEQGDKRQRAVVFDHLGGLALLEKQLLKAEKYYKESLEIYQQVKEPKSQATVLNGLALVYFYSKQLDKAEKFCRDSLKLSENNGDDETKGDSWQCLGMICMHTGRSQEATKWLLKAIDAFKKSGNKGKEMRTILMFPV